MFSGHRPRTRAAGYEKLPEELRQLLEHTDRGVERLYEAVRSPRSERRRHRSRHEHDGGGGAAHTPPRAGRVPRQPVSSRSSSRGRSGDGSRQSSPTPARADGRARGEGRAREATRPPATRSTDASAVQCTSDGGSLLPATQPRHDAHLPHHPGPTCRLVEGRRSREAAARAARETPWVHRVTSMSTGKRGAAHHPPSPSRDGPAVTSLSTPSASASAAAAPSGLSSLEGSGIGGGMRTRFGQRWSSVFHTLFRADGAGEGHAGVGGGGGEVLATRGAQEGTASPTTTPRPARGEDVETHARTPTHTPTPVHGQEQASPTGAGTASTAAAAATASAEAQLGGVLVLRLKEELREREHAMATQRLEHALEVAGLRERVAEARREAAMATRAELADVHAAALAVVQRARDAAQQQAEEARAQRDELRRERAELQERLREAQGYEGRAAERERELAAARAEQSKLRDELATQRRALAAAEEAAATASDRVRELTREQEEQEEAARTTLAKLETELTATTDTYQQLLTDATKRMTRLERVQQKYRALRAELAASKSETQDVRAAAEERQAAAAADKSRLLAELRSTREQLEVAQAGLAELAASQETARAELQRQADAQRASAADQARLLQSQVETAEHTAQLLRTQVESLRRELAEEQAHAQKLAMSVAERELRLQEAQQTQQRSAAAHKVQAEETLAALKRQLREKDAQLKALAASQAEPLQRVRGQLEEERGRRARLEEQLTQYKRKAKEAEEAAMLEIRRERLRCAAALATPRTVSSSSTATPVAMSGGTRAGTAASGSMRGKAVGSSVTAAHGAGVGRSRSSPATREAESPPEIQTTRVADAVRRTPVPARAALSTAEPASAATPSGVGSLSGISVSSPHRSASVLSADADGAPPAGAGVRPVPVLNDTDRTPRRQPARHQPWYAYSGKGAAVVDGQPRAPAVALLSPKPSADAQTPGPSPPRSHAGVVDRGSNGSGRGERGRPAEEEAADGAELREQMDGLLAEEARELAVTGDHERRMREYHASASEVFHRITAGREKFLSECLAVVHASAAAQRTRVGAGVEGSLSDSAEDSDSDRAGAT